MDEDDVISVTVRRAEPEGSQSRETRPPKHDPLITEGVTPITEEHWKIILKLYLRTYRGPNAVEDLKSQLQDYQVLRKSGHVGRGRYVRYLQRGLVDVDLKRGGWVVKCNSTSIHLQDGRRQWRVLRRDNFVFVRNVDAKTGGASYYRKGIIRMLAEEALWQDNRSNAQSEPAVQSPPPRLKANFM